MTLKEFAVCNVVAAQDRAWDSLIALHIELVSSAIPYIGNICIAILLHLEATCHLGTLCFRFYEVQATYRI